MSKKKADCWEKEGWRFVLSMETGGECKRESKKARQREEKSTRKYPKTQQDVAGYGSSDGEGHNVSNQKARMRHN